MKTTAIFCLCSTISTSFGDSVSTADKEEIPDEELAAFWADFIKSNPELLKELDSELLKELENEEETSSKDTNIPPAHNVGR
jgi:hypothetical protein